MGMSSYCTLSCVFAENLPAAILRGFLPTIHTFLLRNDTLQETGREEKREQGCSSLQDLCGQRQGGSQRWGVTMPVEGPVPPHTVEAASVRRPCCVQGVCQERSLEGGRALSASIWCNSGRRWGWICSRSIWHVPLEPPGEWSLPSLGWDVAGAGLWRAHVSQLATELSPNPETESQECSAILTAEPEAIHKEMTTQFPATKHQMKAAVKPLSPHLLAGGQTVTVHSKKLPFVFTYLTFSRSCG